jgi:hypothetical protein
MVVTDVPCDSPRKRGSTNDTWGKVPAAQSAKNCAIGALMDRYFDPHNASRGTSLK